MNIYICKQIKLSVGLLPSQLADDQIIDSIFVQNIRLVVMICLRKIIPRGRLEEILNRQVIIALGYVIPVSDRIFF